jgi:SAM-dependent methyltransferase
MGQGAAGAARRDTVGPQPRLREVTAGDAAESFETLDRQRLVEDALRHHWYHTIEVAPGVVTRGRADLRAVAPRLLPDDLSGLRALDVATFDGFWAFELEKRGAETVAIDVESFEDVDIPPANRERLLAGAGDSVPGERFPLAKQLLGSAVRRVPCSVYQLTAERIGGPVDYAVVSDLLLHLANPVAALVAVRKAMAPGGRLLLSEEVNVGLTLLRPRSPVTQYQSNVTDFNWWQGNAACLRAWLEQAGFADVRRLRFFRIPAGGGWSRWHVAFEARAV